MIKYYFSRLNMYGGGYVEGEFRIDEALAN